MAVKNGTQHVCNKGKTVCTEVLAYPGRQTEWHVCGVHATKCVCVLKVCLCVCCVVEGEGKCIMCVAANKGVCVCVKGCVQYQYKG